jgi:hypothetical protein
MSFERHTFVPERCLEPRRFHAIRSMLEDARKAGIVGPHIWPQMVAGTLTVGLFVWVAALLIVAAG